MMLKSGVRLTDLSPQMVLAALVMDGLYRRVGAECVITSANDSTHSERSLHYKGRALDFRTHNYTADKQQLLADAKAALSRNFDVVLEAVGTPNEHLHVEYDPKEVT